LVAPEQPVTLWKTRFLLFAVFHDPYWVFWLGVSVALVLAFLVLTYWHYRKNRRIPLFLDVVCLNGGIAIMIASLFPARAQIPRAYIEGKDQFEWAAALKSANGAAREKAIVALCELLKQAPKSASVRAVALDAFKKRKATEAIPVLKELLETADKDVRSEIEMTIKEISK
jgi:hypothetical protein